MQGSDISSEGQIYPATGKQTRTHLWIKFSDVFGDYER